MAHEHVEHVHTTSDGGSGYGFVMGIILLIAFLFLLFYFGMPLLSQGGGGTQINVPDKVNVDVQQK